MCECCKFYNPKTNFVGECSKIENMVMPEIPIDEGKDFESYIIFNVRKEFYCNQFEKK